MIALWARELTRISRSPGTPWFLLVYLGLGLLVENAMLALWRDTPQYLSMSGLTEPVMLATLAALQMVLLLLKAPAVAGDIAAHDLERGEQDLLLVTGRSRFALLAVKLAAALTWLGLLWLMYVPLYSLLPRLGSFSLKLLIKVALVQLAPVGAAAALGLLVAQVARSRRTAAMVGTGLVLFALLGSYLVAGMLAYNVAGGNPHVVFGGGPVFFKGGVAPGMLPPTGLGMPVQSEPVVPTTTKRLLTLATLSPAAGLLATLDMPNQPSLMPGLPVFFLSPHLVLTTKWPLWQVQVVGYGALTLLLFGLAWLWTAWPQRHFWRRRYRLRGAAPAPLPAAAGAAGGAGAVEAAGGAGDPEAGGDGPAGGDDEAVGDTGATGARLAADSVDEAVDEELRKGGDVR
jgi:ABC-type transport system involved in multi-copper enzyme maturation permease subunit